MTGHQVAVILPALNEAQAVEAVVEGFLREGMRVIVVDNGSTDGTGPTAARAGAEVVYEKTRGYGSACLAGLSYLTPHSPSIVVFADCDGTLDPHDIRRLIAPIESGAADVVLGRARPGGKRSSTDPPKTREHNFMYPFANIVRTCC